MFQWAFEREVSLGAHLVLVSSGVMAVARQPDATTVAHAWRELSDALPDAFRMAPLHAQVVRERHATFSLAPGQPPRPPMRTAIPRLWLAGDWTETGLPATLEGAALSGHRVAAALIAERDSR